MEEAEQSRYVAQLRAEFDSCDTTSSGLLDRDELTALCTKLHLDQHRPLLLDSLLGQRSYARVTFEEFKEGFVSVLSRSLDFSTSEDDSSYLEPVVPEEVKPKFVKGTKRYGRRSRPDSKHDAALLTCDSEDSPPSRTEATDSSPLGVRRAKLRRSTSLESVESLKSDEEAGSHRDQADFQSKAPQQEEVVEVGGGGGAGGAHVLMAVCDHLGLQQQLSAEELDLLLRKLDADLDGRVSIRDFQKVLCGSVPVSCSTPVRPADLHRTPHKAQSLIEERSARSTSPSLLTATVGQRVLSRLDDGSGCTSPERVISVWTEEGIRNSRDILQTLDFPLEERLSLVDLTLALDNELLVSGNGIHQVALISYKNEIQHLQEVLDQACRERDKVKVDLDQADQRNLQLVREVDDRHANMETLNQSRIRELEQEFRDRLTALRSQSEQENEALLQQVERERDALQDELQLLRAQEAELQGELCSITQENRRVEEELCAVKMKLTEAENSVNKLQKDLDQLLQDKFGSLDPAGAGLSHEERFSEIVKEYELQCRELRDRNDELSSELELLKSQRSDRKWRRRRTGDTTALDWTQQQRDSSGSDSDDSDMKRSSSPAVRKKLQPTDKTALGSLDSVCVSGPAVSIQTELALEQLKQKHNQELQQLHIQLETQVNYYERSLELMRQSMEVERKDISQAFKLEISELEEQKTQVEQQVKQLKEALDKHGGGGGGGGGGWSNEQERRMQWERAELEQNFAREIGNLVQRLSGEKEQLEAELKLKMDQELMLLREEAERLKLQHNDGQRHLLQQLQEQRGLWEQRLVQSEREKLRAEEEREQICSRFSSEREEEEEEQEALRQLKEQVSRLQEVAQSSAHRLSQSEASVEELRRRCARCEEDLSSCRGRCRELEARLQEACAQLEESINVLEEQEALNARVAAEKEEAQEELRSREESVCLLAAELDSLKTDRARLIQDLKEQAMAVDRVSEELERRRRSGEEEEEEEERTRTSQEREEVRRLNQENVSYSRLADQLSTQIVEMEEEISSLRNHLRDLSLQLNDTADLVLVLRTQLNAKDAELGRVQERVRALRRALQEEQDRLRAEEQSFEQEKRRMRQQLMELEQLVLVLEQVMDPASPHRTQLDEVRSENGALQERLSLLQQEVQNLEEQVSKKRRKLEETEREHERSREEEERLHKENSRYREEVLDLSSRNLQLSDDNAELSSRLRGQQESVQMLRERLATVSKEQEEGGATVRRLQDAAAQQQAAWTQERTLLERELLSCRDKLGRLSALEAELSSATLKQQLLQDDKDKLLREADAHNNKVAALQSSALSLRSDAERLRSRLHDVTQEKRGHDQEATEQQRKLEEAQDQVQRLESGTRRLLEEKEELCRVLEQQEERASVVLQEETHRLTVQNQELQLKLSELQVQGTEVHKLNQDQQNLRSRLDQLEAERNRAEEQALQADSSLTLLRAQHLRQLQQLQERAGEGEGLRGRVELLQEQLQEEQRRRRQLEEALKLQAQQSCSQISSKQDQYEAAVSSLQQRLDELEIKLKSVRSVLQEKVQQLKEQLVKSSKSSSLLKDLYVENSELMKALQVTELRQKKAEKKNFLLEEKVAALNKLLRDVVSVALAT